jgi:formylglycine-generating enzyme required for sulfatase activity
MTNFTRIVFSVIAISILMTSCGTSESIDTATGNSITSPSVPPGTTQVDDSLFVDRVPVTNLMYNEFLDNLENYWSMKKHDKMQFYPRYNLSKDTVFQPWTGNTRLLMEASYQDPKAVVARGLKMGNYSSNPSYSYHPAINVSKFQAELFCFWRTDLANAVYAIRSKNKKKRDQYPYKVKYRLPTVAEMVAIENRMREKEQLLYYQDAIFSTAAGAYTFKSLQEEGDMVVLEMKEIAQDQVYNPLFNTPLQYYQPQELKTGFRCVCEIVE